MNNPGTRRLAFRHLLAIVLVTVLFSGGALLYQIRAQYVRGIQERDDVLLSVKESYVPPIAAAVFFFEDQQLQLLAEGITLLPYVKTVTVLERRGEELVPLIAAGTGERAPANTTEFALVYEHNGQMREIGALRVVTSMARVREQILSRIRTTTATSLMVIIAFAAIVLGIVQRMVFRHIAAITSFMRDLDPDHIGSQTLVLPRRASRSRTPDELDEITDATNMMITRLDRALQEKTTLLQELYHRTGNMLQTVRSVLLLQSSTVAKNEQVEAVVRAVDNRILAMALVHQTLYQHGSLSRIDMHHYLPELAQTIFDSYENMAGRVGLTVDVAPLSLLIDTALSCGLVVSELLSNSLEHAFPTDRTGSVSISLVQTDDDAYRLTVSDDGIGVPDDFNLNSPDTIGIPSATGIVAKQLRGTIEFTGDDGVQWHVTFSDDVYRERARDG